ncbi:hypothetical protein [Streptomyces sp. NPDC127038]|uniref:hypothetical protein n=1 Tax=Streptomyces sp. NPDC127038 TaxID=3347114 RepID=UPI0036561D0D
MEHDLKPEDKKAAGRQRAEALRTLRNRHVKAESGRPSLTSTKTFRAIAKLHLEEVIAAPSDQPPSFNAAWEALYASAGRSVDNRAWSEYDEFSNQSIRALNAAIVTEYVRTELCLPQGPQWNEAAATALHAPQSRWWYQIDDDGSGYSQVNTAAPAYQDVSREIRRQARREHRLLVPIWSHRVGGRRLVSLDLPLGDDGSTLHDLVRGGLDPQEVATGAYLDDPRLAAILEALEPMERLVALTWASWKVGSWEEAAALAGAPCPASVGERVRRKLKRLGRRHTTNGAGPQDSETGR